MSSLQWQLLEPEKHDTLYALCSPQARRRGNSPKAIYVILNAQNKITHVAMQYLENGKWERWSFRLVPDQEIKGTWSDMMRFIRPLIGDRACIEVYPRDCAVINTAPVRHFWILPNGLPSFCSLRSIEVD